MLGLHGLATTIGIGCLTITQRISYSRYECIATCVRRVFRLGLSIVRKCYFHGTVKHVINRYGWRHVVKSLVESCLASHSFGYRVVSLSHTTESVIDVASADNHHDLVFRSTTLGSCRYHTVFLHLNGTPEAVHEGDGLQIVTWVLYVVMLGHCVRRCSDAIGAESSLRLIVKGNDVRHTCCQLIRTTHSFHTSEVVYIRFIIEVVEIHTAECHTIAVVEVGCLATVAKCIVYALHIHIHHRLIAVGVPHALSLAVSRKRGLDNVAVSIISVVRDGFAASELLLNLRDMVGIVHVIFRRYMVVGLAVATCYGNIDRKTEDVLGIVRGILNGSLIIETTGAVLAESALVAELIGFQLTVIAVKVILVPCFGSGDAACFALILSVGSIAQGNKG